MLQMRKLLKSPRHRPDQSSGTQRSAVAIPPIEHPNQHGNRGGHRCVARTIGIQKHLQRRQAYPPWLPPGNHSTVRRVIGRFIIRPPIRLRVGSEAQDRVFHQGQQLIIWRATPSSADLAPIIGGTHAAVRTGPKRIHKTWNERWMLC